MKNFILTTFIIAMFTTLAFSQKLTQTVRGTIIDADSKLPIIGATAMILGSDPLVGTATDVNGKFRLENVPIGRITLQLSYLGYESKTIPNIVVNSGKEVVLNLNIQESVVKLDEVVIKPKRKNGEALNKMSLISARSVSIEQTKRYAGTFNDPSRILSNFAGVTSTQDGSNDIIVRGNSPKYIQWRLEGVEITNPNHFADQSYTIGGMSALNNNILATSGFYTGAFSPEYGNALSGVYDIKLRAGNNEKFESSFGFGIIGTDFTVEGPFKKGYTGSYLLNYRYSTVAIIKDIGLIDNIPGAMDFQDMSAKIVLPTKKVGIFSLFALGGLSGFMWEDIDADMLPTPGDRNMKSDIVEDFDKDNYLLNSGLNHTLVINKNSYIKTTLAYSTDGINNDIFESEIIETDNGQGGVLLDTVDRTLNYKSRLKKSAYRSALTYSNKLNAKNKIQIGTKYTLFDYDNNQSMLNDDLTTRVTLINFKENIGVLRNYISWKHRLNKDITIVAGLHNMNVLYNNKSTLEPRIAVNWKLNNTNSVHAGYGKHSNMEGIHNYFIKTELEDGSVIEPNKDLDLLKAHHYVLGYEKRFTENIMAKMEVYYQYLYNLPVENNNTSYYATINGGDEYRYVDLVNEGTGKNYGVEFTLERYFINNYYYLINASLYESKYKSLEGVERNTQHNGNYLVNVLCGKEFENLGKKQNRTLGLNAKISFAGGRKIIPLLRDAQGNLAVDPANNRYWDYDKAYENKIEDNHQVTISVNYKINKPKATHEIKLELQNITGYKVKVTEYYDKSKPNSIGYLAYPIGLFPNLMYRVYF
ncbi:MAG: TonB-dependent receptor [Bacteroidales bacterium]|nr:TonB-dependent receptor [Bacteroidales bacterium]